MKKPFITIKTKIKVQIIFTFDTKEQEMWECEFGALPIDWTQSDWIRNIIENAFEQDIENTKDLVKISMCISANKDAKTIPCVAQMLERSGKYYFQPNQRDEVVNAIIKNSVIASETKPFSELRVN